MLNPLQNQFNQFMQQMKWQDPNMLIKQLLSSGRVSQQQINQAHQKAKEIEQQFDGMKKFFGF